jgi:hypothetical protein
MTIDWQRVLRESERVHTRYHVEVVEALRLCPWAEAARKNGQVRICVDFMRAADTAHALELLDACMRDAHVIVGMLVFPAWSIGRTAFSHFLAAVRAADEARQARGQSQFALADFHPTAEPDLASPERLVPFLRRAPDPMLQVVRKDALDALRENDASGTSFVDLSEQNLANLLALPNAQPSLAERVARNNARTIERRGANHVGALLDAIIADRNASYRAAGLLEPSWPLAEEVTAS